MKTNLQFARAQWLAITWTFLLAGATLTLLPNCNTSGSGGFFFDGPVGPFIPVDTTMQFTANGTLRVQLDINAGQQVPLGALTIQRPMLLPRSQVISVRGSLSPPPVQLTNLDLTIGAISIGGNCNIQALAAVNPNGNFHFGSIHLVIGAGPACPPGSDILLNPGSQVVALLTPVGGKLPAGVVIQWEIGNGCKDGFITKMQQPL